VSTDYTKATATRAAVVPRDELHIEHPPRGITMERERDDTTVIKVRMFSRDAFWFLFFTLVLNGTTWIFASYAVVATAAKFGHDVGFSPIWEGSSQPLWITWLILIPFIVIGFFLMYWTIFSFFGKMEMRVGAREGDIFTGFGSFGRTRRFAPQSVKSVEMRVISHSKGGTPHYSLIIEMDNGREITLPALGKMRETWLAFALNKILGIEQRGAQ